MSQRPDSMDSQSIMLCSRAVTMRATPGDTESSVSMATRERRKRFFNHVFLSEIINRSADSRIIYPRSINNLPHGHSR